MKRCLSRNSLRLSMILADRNSLITAVFWSFLLSNPWILDSTPHVPALMFAQFNALVSLAILTKFMFSLCSRVATILQDLKNWIQWIYDTARQVAWIKTVGVLPPLKKTTKESVDCLAARRSKNPAFLFLHRKKHENAACSTCTLTI